MPQHSLVFVSLILLLLPSVLVKAFTVQSAARPRTLSSLPPKGPYSYPHHRFHQQQPQRRHLITRELTVGGGDEFVDYQAIWNTFTGISALVVGILVLLTQNPKGWVNEKLVEEAISTLGPQAGRGLFALENIPKDTVIGHFPGVVTPRANWMALKDSEEAALIASRYTWSLENGDILDPTLSNGQLPSYLPSFGGLVKIPTLLGLVNEPPVGVDVNIIAVVTEKEVIYKAERDIYQGEELFVDYGPNYNRRHYRR